MSTQWDGEAWQKERDTQAAQRKRRQSRGCGVSLVKKGEWSPEPEPSKETQQ